MVSNLVNVLLSGSQQVSDTRRYFLHIRQTFLGLPLPTTVRICACNANR